MWSVFVLNTTCSIFVDIPFVCEKNVCFSIVEYAKKNVKKLNAFELGLLALNRSCIPVQFSVYLPYQELRKVCRNLPLLRSMCPFHLVVLSIFALYIL